jgi:hypothetical protein
VDQALSVWRPRKSSYLPELARTTFLKAKLLQLAGDEAEAVKLSNEAMALRNRIPNLPQKLDGSSLKDEDFESQVTYFSR